MSFYQGTNHLCGTAQIHTNVRLHMFKIHVTDYMTMSLSNEATSFISVVY